MKVTMEFNLPEDAYELERVMRSGKLAREVDDVCELVRNWNKHGHEFKSADEAVRAVHELLGAARDLLDIDSTL